MQGTRNAKPQKTEILPKWFSHKWGNARGIMAMDSNMQIKGMTQTAESCGPGIAGWPVEARTGVADAIRKAVTASIKCQKRECDMVRSILGYAPILINIFFLLG